MGWFYAEYYELIVMSKVMSLSALVSGECSRSCLHLFLEFGFVAASQPRYDSFLRQLGRLISAEDLYIRYLRVSHLLCITLSAR